jgi:hypothetical protein
MLPNKRMQPTSASAQGARLNQRVMGGALSDHVYWPPADGEYDVDEEDDAE